MALLARERAWKSGVGFLVDVVCADIFTVDLSRLNVVYVYPFPTIIDRLSEKIIAECSRGTRVLVHDYMLRGLSPVRSVEILDGEFHFHLVHLYII
ncbi:MAG: hypothetical protein QXZ68_02065 [Candidatus Bathyarchaeia archaeon]